MVGSGKTHPVLVISNIPWDFVWQRHQTMAALWAREGNVVFCELPGIRRVRWADASRVLSRLQRLFFGESQRGERVGVPAHVEVLRPLILPATNALFCAFNRLQLRRLLARNARLREGVGLVITYSTSRTALNLLAAVPHRQLVYDCTDDWLAVEGIPRFLAEDERKLLSQADLTLVPSETLRDRKSAWARHCVRLPHGAFVERFACADRVAPTDGRLTLLYFGHLHRQHLDFELIGQIAVGRPYWRIILVGPVKTPHLFPANVQLVGQQVHDQLRVFAEQSDVLILPYVMNRYTAAVMPAKTYECLATGRPVVSAPLPGLVAELSEVFRFATGVVEWVSQIEQSILTDTAERRTRRRLLAQANSWDARFIELKRLLAKPVQRDEY
jgi:hypothetical protein